MRQVFKNSRTSASLPLSHVQHLSSRLARLAAEENLCHSFQAFHSSYSDTGLLGIHFVTDRHHIEDMLHWSQNAWSVMSAGQMHCVCDTSFLDEDSEHIWSYFLPFVRSPQDEPVHHTDGEWCSQRKERPEGQPGRTAQWYVICLSRIDTTHIRTCCNHKSTYLFVG